MPIIFSTDDTLDVGEDGGTPVSPTYEAPLTFTGILKKGDGGGQGVVDPSDLGDFDARRSATSFR